MSEPSKIRARFLRSKVAQRIVLLFVCCAMLPVTIVAVLSFYQVSSQLHEDSERQLMRAGKSQGMAIYERLEPLHARILAVADCYDALTSDRPYRQGLPEEQTIAILCDRSGTQFDPAASAIFGATLESR